MENIHTTRNKNKKTKCIKKIQNKNINSVLTNKVEEKFNYHMFFKKYSKIKKKCNKKKNLSRYYFLLDNFYNENLLSILDSFKEIDIKNIVLINDKPWDINLLLDLWGNILCSTEMQNPLPVFPANPFTKKNISIKEFNNITNIIKNNKIKLYDPLKYLFNNYKKVFDYNIDIHNTSKSLSQHLIKILNENYRFRLLNIKNSQDSYIGIWVNKNNSMSDFEVFFDYYNKIPIQIQDNFGFIYDNPEKIQIKNLLDIYPKENNITIYNYYN